MFGYPPGMHAHTAADETEGTARAFGAVNNPEQGAAGQQMLGQLLQVLEATSPGGVI